MYRDKIEILREKELQRMVKMYWCGRRNVKENEARSYVDGPSYDELSFAEGEREELRAIAEERLPMFEDKISHFVAWSKSIQKKSWPRNLFEVLIGKEVSGEYAPTEWAEGVLLSVLEETFAPKVTKCILLLYKDKKPWDEICDEMDIYATELDEIHNFAIRKLRHPDILRPMKRKGVFAGWPEPMPAPVATDEQKEFILRLAREQGISKDKATRGFVKRCIRANPDSVLAHIEYEAVEDLIEYLKETL